MSFQELPFLDVFKDATGGNIKTPRTEFLEEGEFPVVDQGQVLVAGFVNDRSRVCNVIPPVIVFGDHTRSIKYVDFEFAMGADGTKVLVPKVESDTKYLYYALKAIEIPAAGYSRHYKFLKEIQIPLPPLAEQKRIAGILDAADALRAKRREALAQLDTLLQSTFLDMFGDPVANPMGWESRHLPDLVSKRKHALKRGPFGGALKKKIFVPEGFKVYEQKNVIYDDFNIGSYFIKKSDYERLVPFKVSSNNLLISCSGTIGRIAAVPLHAAPGVMNQALLKIDLDESIMLNPFFLGLWRSQSFEQQVLGMTHGTGMKNMKSMAELKGTNFIVPPLDLQRHFAAIVESVEKQKARQQAHLAELNTLFASLQSRAFRGDL